MTPLAWFRGAISLSSALLFGLPAANAQVSTGGHVLSVEVTGATSGLSFGQLAGVRSFNDNTAPAVHPNPAGKPCLAVSPLGRMQLINNDIYDHILLLNNQCGREIKIRACYYKTESCKIMSIGPYQREQQLLGIFPSKDFRYSYREFMD